MSRKLYLLFIALLACGSIAVAAGCGSDNNKKKSESTATPSTQAPSGGGSATNSAAADAAKKGCEAGIKNNVALAADKRSALTAECQKVADAAATGDKAKIKAAYESYCGKLADALPPQAQAPAKSACLQGANSIQ